LGQKEKKHTEGDRNWGNNAVTAEGHGSVEGSMLREKVSCFEGVQLAFAGAAKGIKVRKGMETL